jgi:hypothetical protein
VLATWIDDLAFTAGDDDTLQWFTDKLNEKWSTTNNGEVKDCKVRLADFIVGCHIEQKEGKIKMHHQLLAEKLIRDFKLEDCNPVYTPFASGTEVSTKDCMDMTATREPYVAKYKSGTATVLYLACTSRPELAKFASELGKVQHRPGKKHYAFLKHVVKYIAGHVNDGIIFETPPDDRCEGVNELVAYADASWADQADDRRSTGGYVCLMNVVQYHGSARS